MKTSLFLATLAATSIVTAGNPKMPQSNNANACKSCCCAQACTKPAAQKYIGQEAAITTALAHAGLARAAVHDLKCELDREKGIIIYEVEFESGLYDYEYDIDATTGKILKFKKELD
jgi:uncharacterized membrane protein YkoI